MAETPSQMVALGSLLPEFILQDVVTEKLISNQSFVKRPLLVMFICNHCPYVIHIRDEITKISKDYTLDFLAINSNNEKTHPQDGPVAMKQLAMQLKWTFPFCFDETQEVAKRFKAACTPDFFLYDNHHRLQYRGRLDASTPRNKIAVTGEDLRRNIEHLLSGRPTDSHQFPSLGCNIKWME